MCDNGSGNVIAVSENLNRTARFCRSLRMSTLDSPVSPAPDPADRSAPAIILRLQGVLTLGAIGLFGASYRLWTPQTEFPQTPLLPGFAWPDALAWSWFTVLAAALLWTAAKTARGELSRLGNGVSLLAVALLVFEDQHRLQAWTIHAGWLWLCLTLASRAAIPRLALAVTIAIYAWSAVSKLNPLFAEQHGQMLLNGLLRGFRLPAHAFSASVRDVFPWAFPLIELLIAAGLSWPRTRRTAAWLAVGMHLMLIVILGPLGLNHEPGVLLWNGLFIAQLLALWCFDRPRATTAARWPRRDVLLMSAILLVPALRWVDLLDQWPGWSLYSPRTDVLHIHLADEPPRIDPAFPDFTSEPYRLIGGDAVPREFVPDRWSLAALGVPLNPDARLELSAALAVAERFDAWDRVSIARERRALYDPHHREWQEYRGREGLEGLAAEFRLNAAPNRRYAGAP